MNTIRSSAKHEVATKLDLKSASGADLPCVSCVGGKLARHTFPDQGSDADDVLAVVHVDMCGPFRVAAKDGSLYFLLLKDRKTCYVWVRPVAKNSDALQEFVQWLVVTERHTKKAVLMLRSDRGGEFLGKQFTDFVNGKGIVHDLTCPYISQQNGMVECEMRTVVESVRTMLLHMGVQHHWWHLALRQAVWVFTTSHVVFYENMSLEVWKSEHGPASGQTPTAPPTDNSTATLPLLAKVREPAAKDVEDVPFPSPSPAPCAPSLVADLHGLTLVSASGDEGRSGTSPLAEEMQPTLEKPAKKAPTRQQQTGEQAMVKSTTKQSAKEPTTGEKSAGKPTGDDGGDAEESTESDVVEVQRGPRRSGRIRRPPDFYVPAAFTTAYNEVNDDLQYGDETGRVCKLLKSLYGLKQSPLLWYRALDGVLLGAGWKKSQVDMALYFKVGDDKVTCWVLVYVDDLLAASSSAALLKELLKAAFELREISPVQKYLGLEIVRDKSVRKLWLHQQGYADKLRRRFLDKEQNGRTPKTPVSVDAYATLTFDDEEAQERQEEYRKKVGSLQFAATTTRPDIAFVCSKLGSDLTIRSDQYWREVDRCFACLANTHDTALEFGGGAESLKLCIKFATLSTTESEYVAATEAGKEGRRLRFHLAEFRLLDAGTLTVLRVDSKSAITIAEGMGLMGNLMHMER
ncbi:unnamed protein product [Closterium sp. NIES-54]